jgi:hypothetical protein
MYILSSEPCPSGYEAITVAAVCDIAGVALGLSPGYVTSYDFGGGNCAKYDLGGQVNVYYHGASNQPGATSICAAVTSTPAVPTPSPTAVQTDSCTQLATGSISNDWGTICHNVPTTAGHIQVTMGDVIDFFRPVPGASFCEMLTSSNRHEWSNDLTTWHTPDYYPAHYGGSATNWPANNVEGDDRRFLSFWGASVDITFVVMSQIFKSTVSGLSEERPRFQMVSLKNILHSSIIDQDCWTQETTRKTINSLEPHGVVKKVTKSRAR